MRLTAFICLMILFAAGCNPFQNKRQQEIKERLEKYQEEVDRKADSVRREQYKKLTDSTFSDFERTMDSLKRSSDSLEKIIKKDLEELKRKNSK